MLKQSQDLDLPASALRLYKPTKPVAEPYDENIRTLVLSELGLPLPASRKLSRVFDSAPPEEQIHIIVGM